MALTPFERKIIGIIVVVFIFYIIYQKFCDTKLGRIFCKIIDFFLDLVYKALDMVGSLFS